MLMHDPVGFDLLPWNLGMGSGLRGGHSFLSDFGTQPLGIRRRGCPRPAVANLLDLTDPLVGDHCSRQCFSESWLFCGEVGCFEGDEGACLGEGIGWYPFVLLLEDSGSHCVQIPLFLTHPLCCEFCLVVPQEALRKCRCSGSPTCFFWRGDLGICFLTSSAGDP